MEIVLNGQPHQAAAGCTISGLLEALGIDPARVAIERNGSIIRRPAWNETALSDGDQIEIVHFVGGGKL